VTNFAKTRQITVKILAFPKLCCIKKITVLICLMAGIFNSFQNFEFLCGLSGKKIFRAEPLSVGQLAVTRKKERFSY